MDNRSQHDASTSDLPSCSLPVEWLLEESRQLREEITALLHHRQSLLDERDLLFHRQLLLIERLRILASRLQRYLEGMHSQHGGEESVADVTDRDVEV
jgi:hypothetical protein